MLSTSPWSLIVAVASGVAVWLVIRVIKWAVGFLPKRVLRLEQGITREYYGGTYAGDSPDPSLPTDSRIEVKVTNTSKMSVRIQDYHVLLGRELVQVRTRSFDGLDADRPCGVINSQEERRFLLLLNELQQIAGSRKAVRLVARDTDGSIYPLGRVSLRQRG